MDIITFSFLIIVVLIVLILTSLSGLQIIEEYQEGIVMILGKARTDTLKPGCNFVVPLISKVSRVDTRTEILDIPPQETLIRDNSPMLVDEVIQYRVVDPVKAFFQVKRYKLATIYLTQTLFRERLRERYGAGNGAGDQELRKQLSGAPVQTRKRFQNYISRRFEKELLDILNQETSKWGVLVEELHIKLYERSYTPGANNGLWHRPCPTPEPSTVVSGIVNIDQQHRGVVTVLGKAILTPLQPGTSFVPPLLSSVIKMDIRSETLDLSHQNAITRDRVALVAAGSIGFNVSDPNKAYFQVKYYRAAILNKAEGLMRSLLEEKDWREMCASAEDTGTKPTGATTHPWRRFQNHTFRGFEAELLEALNRETEKWGVAVEEFTFKALEVYNTSNSITHEINSTETISTNP
jgi:regulator of protease activity HflC (stomatin/prohibitin superfamily)